MRTSLSDVITVCSSNVRRIINEKFLKTCEVRNTTYPDVEGVELISEAAGRNRPPAEVAES